MKNPLKPVDGFKLNVFSPFESYFDVDEFHTKDLLSFAYEFVPIAKLYYP